MDRPLLNARDSLLVLQSPALSRHRLVMFCGASGDHNPIHVDTDFAREVGMPDVIAHGMLSMAFMAQLLTNWVAQSRIRYFGVRFLTTTPVNAKVICTGKVVELFEEAGERRAKLVIDAHTDCGRHTMTGEAVVAVPDSYE